MSNNRAMVMARLPTLANAEVRQIVPHGEECSDDDSAAAPGHTAVLHRAAFLLARGEIHRRIEAAEERQRNQQEGQERAERAAGRARRRRHVAALQIESGDETLLQTALALAPHAKFLAIVVDHFTEAPFGGGRIVAHRLEVD